MVRHHNVIIDSPQSLDWGNNFVTINVVMVRCHHQERNDADADDDNDEDDTKKRFALRMHILDVSHLRDIKDDCCPSYRKPKRCTRARS